MGMLVALEQHKDGLPITVTDVTDTPEHPSMASTFQVLSSDPLPHGHKHMWVIPHPCNPKYNKASRKMHLTEYT